MRTRRSIPSWRCAALADMTAVSSRAVPAADTAAMSAESGYGDYDTYVADHEDPISARDFARYNRIASCMADFLAGRAVDAGNSAVREAVHWQIWFMRQRGSLASCFDPLPHKEQFGGYSIERSAQGKDETVKLFGCEVCPMMISVLRVGGVISLWL